MEGKRFDQSNIRIRKKGREVRTGIRICCAKLWMDLWRTIQSKRKELVLIYDFCKRTVVWGLLSKR